MRGIDPQGRGYLPVAVAGCLLVSVMGAFAQDAKGASDRQPSSARVWERLFSETGPGPSPAGRRSDDRTRTTARLVWSRDELTMTVPQRDRRLGLAQTLPPATRRERSLQRKIVGAIVGGVGGFFGGMFLGAAIEGDRCNCDDPGLVGALIGAPIGGAVGGVLGYKWLF